MNIKIHSEGFKLCCTKATLFQLIKTKQNRVVIVMNIYTKKKKKVYNISQFYNIRQIVVCISWRADSSNGKTEGKGFIYRQNISKCKLNLKEYYFNAIKTIST
ncbi:UNVERIFIED_CONTAM: hypothetical protein K2H54_032811 [Gekko kuhli]